MYSYRYENTTSLLSNTSLNKSNLLTKVNYLGFKNQDRLMVVISMSYVIRRVEEMGIIFAYNSFLIFRRFFFGGGRGCPSCHMSRNLKIAKYNKLSLLGKTVLLAWYNHNVRIY